MNSLLAITFIYTIAASHHLSNTTTGAVITHFPSAKVITRNALFVYFRPHEPLQPGETLVARWTPPVIDGPCRVYEYTLPAMANDAYMTTQRWNSAALNMYCPGEWTCELLVRRPTQADIKLHETRMVARRR